MKQFYETSKNLMADMDEVSKELFNYNPGITANRKPVLTIAQSIGTVISNLGKLRMDIISKVQEGNGGVNEIF